MIPVWPKVKLKSLYHGLYDGPHATPKESEDGAIFLGIKNVTEDGRLDLSEIRHIAEEDLAKWTKRVTPSKDDIVFSYEATLHRYARIPEGFRGCLGRRMALIRADKSKVDINYLFSYFLSPLWRAEVEKHILSGATVDRIPLTNVPEFELFLPPLPIQKKISAILTSYDDLIENNLKRIKLLEEMAQITYEEWFVRMKFPGHENAVFDEETGLPEGWSKQKISDIGTVVTGKTPSTSNEEFYGSDIPFIKTPDMAKAPYILDTEQALSELGAESQSNKLLPKNSLVVSCIGTAGEFGLVSEPSQTNQQINAIKFKKATSTFYMYCFSKHLKPLLEALGSNGATMTNVNKSKFEGIDIVVPTEQLLHKLDNFAKNSFESILMIQKQNKLLKEARDILLPRLMTGMIDIEQVEFPEAMLKLPEQQENKMAAAV